MKDSDDIPDEWDEHTAGDAPERLDKFGRNVPRPKLDPDSERLRAAWIHAVRDLASDRTGRASNYTPGALWDGGKDAVTGRMFKQAIWPRIVVRARERGLDPLALVAALFSSRSVSATPTPNDLIRETNVARAVRECHKDGDQVAAALRTEEAIYRSALWSAGLVQPDKTAAARFVLNDTGRSLSPLFRYCAAVLVGLPDTAAQWYEAARQQYLRGEPIYRERWAGILPKSMTDREHNKTA